MSAPDKVDRYGTAWWHDTGLSKRRDGSVWLRGVHIPDPEALRSALADSQQWEPPEALRVNDGIPPGGVHYGRGRIIRPDQAPASTWRPQRDGSWLSPAGRRFRRLPEGVRAARIALGLPMSWQDAGVSC